MKFGARFSGSDLEGLTRIAIEAEACGFESLWRGEHVIIPRVITSFDPYYSRGLPPGIESFPVLDPVVLMAYVAARTSRIRLGLGVFVLPLRNPVEAARTLMTLDVVSNGRLLVGIGMGWLREEFEILGQPFRGRGARAEEAIEVMRRLWTQPHPEFQGMHYQLPPVTFEPRPVQRPHPPLLIGGVSSIALERAARIGDGWYGHDLPVSVVRACIERINRRRDELGLLDKPFDFTTRVTENVTAEDLRVLQEIGVSRLVVDVGSCASSGVDEVIDRVGRFSDTVMSQLGASQ